MKQKNTKSPTLCISIAKQSGMFGTIVHNAGYEALKLNFIYKAFSVTKLEDAIRGVKAFGIKGCSVSMPYKEKVIKYLDKLDPLAKKVGAVNTIVNDDNTLVGYNTDVIGVTECLKKFNKYKKEKILVIGAGGMARAVLVALENLKFSNIALTNRTKKNGINLINKFDFEYIPWMDKDKFKPNFIINATSIGMYPNSSMIPISKDVIKQSKIIVDVVTNPPETKLIKFAKRNDKIVISGLDLALHQALSQFKLYTGQNPPKTKMQKAINEFYR